MFGIGASELIIIFLFALLFIGPKKLPELAKGLGKGIREFQKAKDDLMDHVNIPASDEHKIKNEDSAVSEQKEETVQEVSAVSEEKEDTVQEVSAVSEDKEETVQEVTAVSEDKKETPKSDA